MMRYVTLIVLIGAALFGPRPSHAHGRLWEPPSRSTMWRRGFNTPVNYNDNELFCGGFWRQVANGYKCGVCGDPWDGPRVNEAGGQFATGQIARTYRQGERITVQVDLTANHKGFFEFKLCPVNNPRTRATQDCLNRYPLTLADGSGSRFYVSQTMGNAMLTIPLILPPGLTCDHCVMQWRYHTGNSWGKNQHDERECVGCGQQEEFYGCADVRVMRAGQYYVQHTGSDANNDESHLTYVVATSDSSSSGAETKSPGSEVESSGPQSVKGQGFSGQEPSLSGQEQESSISGQEESLSGQGTSLSGQDASPSGQKTTISGQQAGSDVPTRDQVDSLSIGGDVICRGSSRRDLDAWCHNNCRAGYCPSQFCACVEKDLANAIPRPKGCRGVGAYASVAGMDSWCSLNCAQGFCPGTHCAC